MRKRKARKIDPEFLESLEMLIWLIFNVAKETYDYSWVDLARESGVSQTKCPQLYTIHRLASAVGLTITFKSPTNYKPTARYKAKEVQFV